jgi:hypothetical protein
MRLAQLLHLSPTFLLGNSLARPLLFRVDALRHPPYQQSLARFHHPLRTSSLRQKGQSLMTSCPPELGTDWQRLLTTQPCGHPLFLPIRFRCPKKLRLSSRPHLLVSLNSRPHRPRRPPPSATVGCRLRSQALPRRHLPDRTGHLRRRLRARSADNRPQTSNRVSPRRPVKTRMRRSPSTKVTTTRILPRLCLTRTLSRLMPGTLAWKITQSSLLNRTPPLPTCRPRFLPPRLRGPFLPPSRAIRLLRTRECPWIHQGLCHLPFPHSHLQMPSGGR